MVPSMDGLPNAPGYKRSYGHRKTEVRFNKQARNFAEAKMNEQVFFTVDEARGILRIGRSLFYELVKERRLKVVKLAGKTLVRKDDLDHFIATLAA